MRVIPVIIVILITGAYFWYVRGVDIGPIAQQITRVRVHVSFEEVADPLESQDESLGVWSRMPDMPTPRSEVAVAALEHKIYVMGGIDGFGRSTDVVEVFDAQSKTWDSFTALPMRLHHAAAAILDGKLYVIGGMAGLNFEPAHKIWVLREDAREWKELADIPEAIGAAAAVGFSPEGGEEDSEARVYVFGGIKSDGLSQKTFAYYPAQNEWRAGKPIPTPREHLGAASIGGQIYVVGGRERSLKKNLDTLEVYDPAKDTWSVGLPMPTKRGGITATVLGGKLYVFGGEYIFGTNDEVEVFDPKKKAWDTLNPMPTARHGLGSAVVGNAIYVIAGGKHPAISVSGIIEAFIPPEFVKSSEASDNDTDGSVGLGVEIPESDTGS